TIADVVPLVDENRSLAIAGLRALARTAKPGLRALMESAGVDPATVDAGAVGFRLAPRLNAAGRLGHPREALELLLTEDEAEARRLADSLEELNRERQAVESRILREAVAQVEAWPPEKRARHAYAVAGADWHEGVIGIVASRLVERYHRPVVLIAGTEGDWRGSGRSIPSFDLHSALGACAAGRTRCRQRDRLRAGLTARGTAPRLALRCRFSPRREPLERDGCAAARRAPRVPGLGAIRRAPRLARLRIREAAGEPQSG